MPPRCARIAIALAAAVSGCGCDDDARRLLPPPTTWPDGGLPPPGPQECPEIDVCESDRCCAGGDCTPWSGLPCGGWDDDCRVGPSPWVDVRPELQCAWEDADVFTTPIVAPLGLDMPAVVFVTHEAIDYESCLLLGRVAAIRGDDCSTIFLTDATDHNSFVAPAVGDLDADGTPEIVAAGGSWCEAGAVRVYSPDGALLAESDLLVWSGAGAFTLANLDGDENAEIVFGAIALRYLPADGRVDVLWDAGTAGGGGAGPISAAADLDLDGRPEVVLGNRILDGATGADETPPAMAALEGGYPAVADFDPDTDEPEIVVVGNSYWDHGVAGTARVQRADGDVIFGPISTGANGGPPTVADFDGDGRPEFAAASENAYTVFDLDCVGGGPGCDDDGIRWRRDTQDVTSGITGSSVFDFNGDGYAEVVYNDECWLRVYDGTTGAVLFAQANTSGTATENPVVADVDGDGATEIVVVGNWRYTKVSPGFDCSGADEADIGVPWTGLTSGVYVYRDPEDAWVATRALWNQHAYHITNVEDDGAIPTEEEPSWSAYNSYRQNLPGEEIPPPPAAADLTVGPAAKIDPTTGCPDEYLLDVVVHNRGAAPAPAPVGVAFYEGEEPSAEALICATQTTMDLAPGGEEPVSCTWMDPPEAWTIVTVVVDDDGAGAGAIEECREANNVHRLQVVGCGTIE